MKKIENTNKKKYDGMKAIPIKGIGIRNNTKTHINGGRVISIRQTR